jgi:hypothetical protein
MTRRGRLPKLFEDEAREIIYSRLSGGEHAKLYRVSTRLISSIRSGASAAWRSGKRPR